MYVITGQKDPKLRWMVDPREGRHLKRYDILLNIGPENNDDALSWYVVAKILRTCIEFIHEAIE